jgi:hypothetical protein
MTTAPTVQTTVVGSYPLPEWLRAYPTRDHLRNATVVAVRPEELAGLAVLSDGELSRFDVTQPETSGMIDYLVGQMDGVSTRITAADADAFRRQQGKGYRAAPAAVVAGPLGPGTLDLASAAAPLRGTTSRRTEFIVTGSDAAGWARTPRRLRTRRKGGRSWRACGVATGQRGEMGTRDWGASAGAVTGAIAGSPPAPRAVGGQFLARAEEASGE